MRITSATMLSQLAQPQLSVTALYRVQLYDDNAVSGQEDLFLTQYPTPIEFFKRDGDVYTDQTYTPFPVKHGALSENTQGQIEQVDLVVGNANGTFSFYFENLDIRGKKVTIWWVSPDLLADEDDYIEEVYYIETISVDDKYASVRLTSKLDILSIESPHRLQLRNYCNQPYKGEGCWESDGSGGYQAPSGFDVENTSIFNAYEASDRDNSTCVIGLAFTSVDLYGLDLATDKLLVDLMCDNPARLQNTGYLKLSSNRNADDKCLKYDDLTGLGITNAWQTFELPFATGWAAFGANAYDPRQTNFFGWYQPLSAGPNIYCYVRNIRIFRLNPFNFVTGSADSCNQTWENCRLHNNTRRFGGKRTIPMNKVFRI